MGTIFGNRVLSTNTHAAAVTPSDTANLATPSCALLATVGGNIKIDTVGGETIILAAVAGAQIDIAAKKVYATLTTATGIVALY